MPTVFSRALPLDGLYNLRDIGGYPTSDGRQTRWRTVFRADSPHRLTAEGRKALADAGVRTVIDLRRPSEAADFGYDLDDAAITRLPLPIFPDAPPGGARTLDAVYRAILDDRQDAIAGIFSAMVDAFPVVVHCTAGKDRTGMVIALLLGLAGVPDAFIAEDYALSSAYLTGPYWEEARQRAANAGIAWEDYQRLLICPPELMLATLAYLDDRYGGAEPYLRKAGLSDSQLRAIRTAIVES